MPRSIGFSSGFTSGHRSPTWAGISGSASSRFAAVAGFRRTAGGGFIAAHAVDAAGRFFMLTAWHSFTQSTLRPCRLPTTLPTTIIGAKVGSSLSILLKLGGPSANLALACPRPHLRYLELLRRMWEHAFDRFSKPPRASKTTDAAGRHLATPPN